MRKIQILGPGCHKCIKLEEITRKAADELGIEYEIEKVKDIKQIMDFGVMITPALVVDGVVKAAGRLPSLDEIKKLITK